MRKGCAIFQIVVFIRTDGTDWTDGTDGTDRAERTGKVELFEI